MRRDRSKHHIKMPGKTYLAGKGRNPYQEPAQEPTGRRIYGSGGKARVKGNG